MFDDLRDLYQEVILDHGRKPRNFRRLGDADRAARGDNPMCGDRMELWLKLGPSGERLTKSSMRSPQSGLSPRATRPAPSSRRKFRGFRPWSRMTSW